MPFTPTQKQAAIAGSFVNAPKPVLDYINKIGLDTLYSMHTTSAPGFTRLVTAFYPDQLSSLHRGLTAIELNQLRNMDQATLNSLGQVSVEWVKSMLRVIHATSPTLFVNTNVGALPAAVVGVIANTNGGIDPTSTQTSLANHCVTELNPIGTAVRNLIFSAAGNCVAEINFANHGGTAISGHAHVYPVKCVPITGHHISGTPHILAANYPAVWRQLPHGVAPATALGT